jgi:hypothetical protein
VPSYPTQKTLHPNTKFDLKDGNKQELIRTRSKDEKVSLINRVGRKAARKIARNEPD